MSRCIRDTLDVVSVQLVCDRTIESEGVIYTARDAVNLLARRLIKYGREMAMVIYLDNEGRVLNSFIAGLGNIKDCPIAIGELIKVGLLSNASGVILMHNHPSGSLRPSKADMAITNDVKKACSLVKLELLDHIIVGARNDKYLSMHDAMLCSFRDWCYQEYDRVCFQDGTERTLEELRLIASETDI